MPWVVGGQVVDPRPAAVFGGRIPLSDALPLPEGGVRLHHDRRARQPSEKPGDRALRPRQRSAGARQHFLTRVEGVRGITAQPLEQPRDVARAERPDGDQLHGILELIQRRKPDLVDRVG